MHFRFCGWRHDFTQWALWRVMCVFQSGMRLAYSSGNCCIDSNQILFNAASLTERDNRLTHYFGQFWGLGLLLGYLATSGAKSDVVFLLGDPIFYKGDEISRLPGLVFEIWRGSYLYRQTRRPLQKALTLTVCEPYKCRQIYTVTKNHTQY